MEAVMVQVYFATNRVPDANAPGGFGSAMQPTDGADKVLYGTVDVQDVDLNDESSGQFAPAADVTPGNYSDAATAAIVGAKNNLLVFIHGFDNSYADAMKRAAFNAEWLRQSDVPSADTTALAFSWPSAGAVFTFPHLDYESDQAKASLSAAHIGWYLDVLDNLRRDYRKNNPDGKIFLLAHSMGNHALQGAIQWWFQQSGPAEIFFDEAILAAADEVDDTFEAKNDAKLSALPKLARRITTYYSRRDVAMYLSTTLNLDSRLGFDGPDDKRNQATYPTAKFRIVDCTDVTDYNLTDPPDATHQYYRRSEIVRQDIAELLDGEGGGGLVTLQG
jgi:esterase/lipase superfamily enzyme